MRFCALLLTASVLAACGESQPSADDAVQQAAAAPSWIGDVAQVANAIERTPAAADSILAANDMTRAAFDSLMYEIATDSMSTAAYEAQRTK